MNIPFLKRDYLYLDLSEAIETMDIDPPQPTGILSRAADLARERNRRYRETHRDEIRAKAQAKYIDNAKHGRECSISGCAKKACNSRGWCGTHYKRWRVHGDPLGGGRTGHVQEYFRGVVLVYEGDECLQWPFSRNAQGYGVWGHYGGRSGIVSRVICEEISGPRPTPAHEAAHSCGKGHEGCVTKRHISWKTKAENQADRVIHGTSNRGEQCAAAKLTKDDVLRIRKMEGVMFQRDIAKEYGVSRATISDIQRRNRWAWLESDDPTPPDSTKKRRRAEPAMAAV